MKNKRFLAIFLVLTMLVSLMPVGFAADEPEEELVVEEAEEVAERAAVPEEEIVAEEPDTQDPADTTDPTVGEEDDDSADREVVVEKYSLAFVNADEGFVEETIPADFAAKIVDIPDGTEFAWDWFPTPIMTGYDFAYWTYESKDGDTIMLAGAEPETPVADGWSDKVVVTIDDEDMTTPAIVSKTVTLTAVFDGTAKPVNVSFDATLPDGNAPEIDGTDKVFDAAYAAKYTKNYPFGSDDLEIPAEVAVLVSDGYVLEEKAWYDQEGNELTEDYEITSEGPIVFTPKWVIKGFDVLFDDGTHPAEVPESYVVTYGSQVAVPDDLTSTDPDAPEFRNWKAVLADGTDIDYITPTVVEALEITPYSENADISDDGSYYLWGSVTLTGTWKDTVTVTFMNGEEEFAKKTVGYGDGPVELPATNPTSPEAGKEFSFWALEDGTMFDPDPEDGFRSDVTVYAEFGVAMHEVTFKSDVPGASPIIVKVYHGQEIGNDFVEVPEKPGTEGFWYVEGDEEKTEVTAETVVTEPMTLVVERTDIEYTITFDTVFTGSNIKFDDGTKVLPIEELKYGQEVTIQGLQEIDNYRFAVWSYVDEDGTEQTFDPEDGEDFVVIGDVTLTAVWVPFYNVTFINEGPNGFASRDEQEYKPISFKYFLVDEESESILPFGTEVPMTPEAIKTFTDPHAEYEAPVYEPAVYDDNDTGRITKNSAYFDGWADEDGNPVVVASVPDVYAPADAPVPTMIDGDIVITAGWRKGVTVTLDGGEDSTISIGSADFVQYFDVDVLEGLSYAEYQTLLYPEAEVVDYPKATKDKNMFVKWLLNGKTFDKDSVVEEQVTVQANWAEQGWIVTFDPDNGSEPYEVTVRAGHFFTESEDFDLAIPEKENYAFVGWGLVDPETGDVKPYAGYPEYPTGSEDWNAAWAALPIADEGNDNFLDYGVYTFKAMWEEAAVADGEGHTFETIDAALTYGSVDEEGNIELTVLLNVENVGALEFDPVDYDGRFESVTLDLNNHTFSNGEVSSTTVVTVKNGNVQNVNFIGVWVIESGKFDEVKFADGIDLEVLGGSFDQATKDNIEALDPLPYDAENYAFPDEPTQGYYELKLYKALTFHLLDPAGVEPEDVEVVKVFAGESTIRPDPDPRENGYRFDGWFLKNGEDWGSEFEFGSPLNKSTEVYSKWTKAFNVYYFWTDPDADQTADNGYDENDDPLVEVYDLVAGDLFPEVMEPVYKDEKGNNQFDFWGTYDGGEVAEFDLTMPVTAAQVKQGSVVLFAFRKAEVEFDPMNGDDSTVVYVHRGDAVDRSLVQDPPDKEDGSKFVNWYHWDGGAEPALFDFDASVFTDDDVFALYNNLNWQIAWYDDEYVEGEEIIQTDENLLYVGSKENPVRIIGPDDNNEYYMAYTFVGPSGITVSNAGLYSMFVDGSWKTLSSVIDDDLAPNGHVMVTVKEELSVEAMKQWADQVGDNGEPIAFTYKFARTADKDDESKVSTLTVFFDPNYVQFGDYKEVEEEFVFVPTFAIQNYRYEFSVDFETGVEGAENPDSLTILSGTEYATLAADWPADPEAEGYDFIGWTADPEADPIVFFEAEDNHTLALDDLTLYGVWYTTATVTFTVNGKEFVPAEADFTDPDVAALNPFKTDADPAENTVGDVRHYIYDGYSDVPAHSTGLYATVIKDYGTVEVGDEIYQKSFIWVDEDGVEFPVNSSNATYNDKWTLTEDLALTAQFNTSVVTLVATTTDLSKTVYVEVPYDHILDTSCRDIIKNEPVTEAQIAIVDVPTLNNPETYWTATAPVKGKWAEDPEKFDLTTEKITEDMTLYLYTKQKVTVTFDANGGVFTDEAGETSTVTAITIAQSAAILTNELPTATLENFEFDYWTAEEPNEGTWEEDPVPFDFRNTPIVDDLQVWAKWKAVLVPVTFYTSIDDTTGTVVEVAQGQTIPESEYPVITDLLFTGKWSTVPYSDSGFPKEFDKTTEIKEAISLWAIYDTKGAVTVEPALNLHDTIGINFYVQPAAETEAKDLTVNVSYTSKYQTVNDTYKLSDLTPKDGEYKIYAVKCASDEMLDEVTLTVKNGDKEVFNRSYSIYSIANVWLNDGNHRQYDGVIRAMLQYGTKAQDFFDNHKGEDITPAGAPDLVEIPGEYAPGTDPTTLDEYLEYVQFGVNLESSVGMTIYIKPKDGVGIDDISVTVEGKTTSAPVLLKSGEIKVTVPGLYPEELLSDLNVVVTVKGVSATYVRSVMSCAYVLEQKGTAVELVEALYQYALAADEIW